MINFVLKYTGTYGLLAILALAIVTPSYFFFSNQQEKLSEASPKKQVINDEERILEKGASEEKTEENIEKPENDEGDKNQRHRGPL